MAGLVTIQLSNRQWTQINANMRLRVFAVELNSHPRWS
jgi:hypothetical protein